MKIDPEFRSLIAPLQPEERDQLEANLVEHGCRDPLAFWRGILIDGHNRYEICERLKIKYRTVEIALPSREHVLLWIEQNQLGRRNLTDDQRGVILDSIVERRAEMSRRKQLAKAREQKGKPKSSVVDTASTTTSKERVRTELAREQRIPERKLKDVRFIKKNAPAAVPAIRSGEKTILEVKREIREQEREQKREANRQLIAAPRPVEVLENFATIVIDPPWDWGDEGDADQFGRARPTYATMSFNEIKEQPVGTWFGFQEQLAFSNGHAPDVDSVFSFLKYRIPNFKSVRRAVKESDRAGVDFYIERHGLLSLGVDLKLRGTDYSVLKAFDFADDLALETFSVIETGKIGWTRDPGKMADFVLWFWKDTGRFCIVSFPALCCVFQRYWEEWKSQYTVLPQESREGRTIWHSECVLVPRRLVLAKLADWWAAR